MNVIWFILLLFIIVVIHEFGHLIAAKIFGVYCSEFSFGMGPKIFSKKGKETTYSIRLFPLGGFVAMAGDNDNALEPSVVENLPKERTLKGIHPFKKIIIMYAGIIMNLILGLVIFSMIILSNGFVYSGTNTVIADLSENEPAIESGLKVNDKIIGLEINEIKYEIDSYDEFANTFALYDGDGSVVIEVEREGKNVDIELTPLLIEDNGTTKYRIGIYFSNGDKIPVNFFTSFYYGLNYIVEVISLIFTSLINLFRGIGLESLSGPIGIYQTTKEVVTYGPLAYLELIALLSINVGIFNALPIPVMDGGRVLITICEIIIGKPINKKLENTIMTISVILILLLFVIVTFKDIINLF